MEISLAIKELHYNNFFKPLFKFEPDGSSLMYYYDNAFRLWKLGGNKEDIIRILKVQEICNDLYKRNPNLLINLIKGIHNKVHDDRLILETVHEKYNNIEDEIIEEKYLTGFELYKCFYENEFSLWCAPILAYLVEYINPSLKKGGDIDYLNVSGGFKYNQLNTKQYGFDLLVKDIDSIIRNSGAGHGNWEILDDGSCIIKDLNPYTGKEKTRIKLTIKELSDILKNLEKTILDLELGIEIFILNEPSIQQYIILDKERISKIKEIERVLNQKAAEFQMKIDKIEFSDDRNILKLELGRVSVIKSAGISTIYTDSGIFDVIQEVSKVKYIENAFALTQETLYLNGSRPFELLLVIKNELDEEIFKGEFSKEEISKLGYDKKIYPMPRNGNLPDNEYELIIEYTFAYGMGYKFLEFKKASKNPLFTKKYLYNLAKNIIF